jgi:hypothetical protein
MPAIAMKKRKTLLVVLTLVVLAYLAWRYLGGGGDAALQAESPDLAVNRVWVDSQPDKYTDRVNAFLMVEGARLGVFQDASQYAGRFEIFEYRRKGANVDLKFPQDGRDGALELTVTACTELHPFDLCLDMKDNPWGGPTRYYGMRDEEQGDGLVRLHRALAATVERTAAH